MATMKDKLAGRVVRVLSRFRTWWAKGLAGFMQRFSRRGQRRIVVVFCTTISLSSLYLIVVASTGKAMKGIMVTPIRSPSYVTTDVPEPKVFITASEYRLIVTYKKYIDSLLLSDKGKLIADSITRARPGLMDSVLKLEKLYHLQNNNR